jgi:hypothetical protein
MSPMQRVIALCVFLVSATAVAETHVPDDLKDWQQWVLKDREYRTCPFFFDRTVEQSDAFICSWPGEIQLRVDASGARFSQQWTVYAKEQWIVLPGGADYWPDQVMVNDRRIEVIAHNNNPGIKLGPGTWRVSGRFEWDERPGVLRIPPQSGLVSLTVDGKVVERPEMNRAGVFLGERQRDTRARDSVRTIVHRLVADGVPTRLVTRLQIDVSGSVREEIFGPILPEGFVPLSIDSSLPAKLEADGNLHLQVRPGRWIISLVARGAGVEDSISRPQQGKNLAVDEIWSFRSNDQLRVTAVEGLPPVDPIQVEVPAEWRSLPAFRMDTDAEFSVTERSRGVVSARNELKLNRVMWLDFDGTGFVVKDSIDGSMRADWRLDMGGPYALLSATEYGENLLITEGQDEGRTGVEVRQSAVDVEAIGRADTRGSLPVTGWDSRFVGVQALLNLPPGHKLLMAPGVDNAAGSWMSRWQLLDFFLVLIITIGVWRLFGRGAGLIALGALVLSFHELNAPSWLWLNLLIAIALMRVAPVGRLRQIVSGYQSLSAVALIVVLVPFVAGQLRVAIYPQLEPQVGSYQSYGLIGEAERFEEGKYNELARSRKIEPQSLSALSMVPAESADSLEEIVTTGSRIKRDFSRYAPNAIVQAGPGIPSWHWNTYSLSWSGPVDMNQSMRLVVMPRWFVSLMRVAAVALLLLFAGLLAAEMLNRKWKLPGGLTLGGSHPASIIAVGLLAGLMVVSPQAKAEYPDARLLQQLEQRLLEAPDCVPRCAEIVSADVQVGAETISMTLSVHALENVAIPLPGSAQGWRPEIISLNGTGGVRILKAPNNSLWMHVAAGRHTVTLRGSIPAVDSLEIPFITPPRVIEVDSDAWFIAGTKDRRLTSGSLQLTRLQSAGDGDGTVRWESSRFPAFARIERVVELDLDWRVRTTVYRVAPTQGALTLDIPLLAGETVVSGDFTVKEDHILVSMNPQQHSVSWTSNLPLQSPLSLQAADSASWQEVWHFVVGNVWNAVFDGLPESNMSNGADGVRVAVFHPRGGETLTLEATRPSASAGSTLAFDSVNIAVNEGSRTRDVSLQLSYRSTRGSQHVMQLPTAAELTSVQIDGRMQTLRAEDGQLTLPILPGNHLIAINWRESGGMGLISSTPEIDIDAPASNINITVAKSRDRWLLATNGPKLGPAVMYWPELAALIVFALILGRIKLTPLTTRHWLLLGLGFSTFSWSVLALVIIWLMLCGAREKSELNLNWWKFDLVQIVIAGMTVVALLSVVLSLPAGLLGTPDMHVAGHNSYGNVLNWFADGSESLLPTASVITVPLWAYKVLILVWALWLSFALLRWLPWVWKCFSSDGFWRSRKSADGIDAVTESAK